MLTVDELRTAVPAHLKPSVSQEMVDKVNTISLDPLKAEAIRENFLTFVDVMKEGRFKFQDYLNAVNYVSHKLMGLTNREAYQQTFPQRYADMVAAGKKEKDIASMVSIYNKTKLVGLVYERSMIPTWVLNQDVFQKAINVQAELMTTASSEKVRTDAANSILTHLKRPETKQVELNIGVQENEGMNELKDMLTDMANQQQSLIGSGVKTRDIAHQKLGQGLVIDGEVLSSGQEPHHTTPQQKPISSEQIQKVSRKVSQEKPLSGFKPQ